MTTLDVKLEDRNIPQETLYIRVSSEVLYFLEKCQDEHGIIGFEYDVDDPSMNLGVIVRRNA